MTKLRIAAMLAVSVLSGCNRNRPTLSPPAAPEVLFVFPTEQVVTEYEEFTGRTESTQTVDVRARVTGYLNRSGFKDGADVKRGDILFEIDPRTYQAELDRAEANQTLARARVARVALDVQRAESLHAKGAMADEEYDKIIGDHNEAKASLAVAKASVESARLNLNFTKVVAPLSGRISRTLIDPGNLVKADDTLLTTIVAQDPMFAYFDVDERTMLRLRRLVQSGKIRSARKTAVSVELGLTDEEGYSQTGTIDFIDNHVVANTGTLRARGIFPNPNGLLSPGLFVRIRMPIGDPHTAIMIPEQALASDQGQRFVYVIDEKNVVQYRKVKIGQLQDGLRVIEQGASLKDRVVVSGLQRIRPALVVDPKPADMHFKTASAPTVGD